MTTTGPSRAEQTRRTRWRMLDSARALFLQQGFAATTVAQIAARAEVAEQTIYYTFRTKGRLLIEVVEITAAGSDDPEPVPERAWFQQMLRATSGRRVLTMLVEHGTGIYERVAALWPAVTAAAATDHEVAEYWHGIAAGRRSAERAIVTRIAELDELRPGLDVASATDLVVVLAGHEVYRGLVEDAGWPVPQYRSWLFTTLVRQLLDEQAPDAAATDGLALTAADP